MKTWRCINFYMVLLAILVFAFVLWISHKNGLTPCPLCLLQRFSLIMVAVVALMAVVHHPRKHGVRVGYSVVLLFFVVTGIIFAGRQVWLQNLPLDQVPACGIGLRYMWQAMPLLDVFKHIIAGSGDCALVHWTFLQLSMAVWSFVLFFLLALLTLYSISRR